MEYSCTIVIDGHRDKVTELFDEPDNLKHWQDGLQSFELISGEMGQSGSKSRIHYKMGKREIEMIETLEVHDMPETMIAVYEAKGVWNRNVNRFIEIGDQTRWDLNCEFKCKGLVRILSALMPGMFRKQTSKMMQDFKTYAERELGS